MKQEYTNIGCISDLLSFVSCSLQNFHLSLFFLSFLSPAFPSAASIWNPPVSYYSPVVRHCAHWTKHHGDSPAALSARDIWQYPNERSTGETTWEETRPRKIRRRKIGRIKKELAGEISLHPRRNARFWRPIVNRFDRKKDQFSLELFVINLQNQLLCHIIID